LKGSTRCSLLGWQDCLKEMQPLTEWVRMKRFRQKWHRKTA
jgi:hypothetical protein